MRSPYFITQKDFIVSESLLPVRVQLIRDKSELSREDRFILEKHSHDIFRMLLKQLVAMDFATYMSNEDKQKAERLLAEYVETKTILTRD